MLVVSWFIGGIMCLFTYCYLFCRFLNKNFSIKSEIVVSAILAGIIYFMVNKYAIKYDMLWIRPLILHIYFLLSLLYMYKERFIKTLISLLCVLIISFVSEIIYGFVVVLLFRGNIEAINSCWYGNVFSNVIVFGLTCLIGNISIVKKMVLNIVGWYNKNEYKSLIMFVMLSIIIFTFLLYNNFIKILPSSILWLTNIFSVGVIIFVVGYFKEKANNNRIVTEYDQLLDYVQKYEKLIESKSKNQHEYKNQLVLIKNMISKTNKKAIEYIDNLYNEESDDEDVELLKKLQYLPNGGLKGLIYYKLEEMKDKKINFFVDISPKVKNVKINKKLDKNLKDISKVIGVYLDNAIEASLNSKEKYIVLEVYVEENEWVFSISNTYNGKVSINKIDTEKFSTKGEGRGYGLSLAKDIINRSKILRQERELKGIYYTQRLYMRK